jgi:hypothetical protein
LPLAKLQAGRYVVQAIVVAPGTQHSAFGRTYLALQQEPMSLPPNPAANPVPAPSGTETPKPPSR